MAAKYGDEAVVKLLLKAKGYVNAKDNFGETALCMATRNGHEAIVKLLLEAKADASVRNHKGKTALDYAATYKFTAVAKLLQETSEKPQAVHNRKAQLAARRKTLAAKAAKVA